MPLNGQFIQMLSTLSEIKARNRQLDMQEKQYNSALKQYEEEHHDKDITELLQGLAASTADSRNALIKLKGKNFTADEISYLEQFAAGQPIDPRLFSAESVGRGVKAMAGTPMQALADREAALRNNTGGGIGTLNTSNFQGGLMAGQPAPGQVQMAQDRLASGMDPQALAIMQSQQEQGLVPQMAKIQAGAALSLPQIAANTLTGRGLDIQQQQANTGSQQATAQGNYWQSQAEVAWAGLRQEDRKIAQEFGLESLFGKGKGGAGAMTAAQQVEAQVGLSKIIAQMSDPQTDERARSSLIGIFNTAVATMGLDHLLINNPQEAPQKVQMFQRWFSQQRLTTPPSMPDQRGAPAMPPNGNPMSMQLQQPQQPQNPMQNFFPGMPSFPSYVPSPSPFQMRPNP